ncbi:hypothetical protein DFH08DRAFT_810497 [Mycena albidolilacea]|uniref:Uncharacterized protein n=1 Tax=Mycena albidolilacea TaxID=1033008 RepID=A0AAD6ZZI6_9AGAR|nr:hypothetical protein DFH08DRAFT_810497 [Mycena albidolilacea]
MSCQIFLAFLLHVINYIFGVHLILVLEAPLDNEKRAAIVQTSVLSNSDWLLFLQKPSDDSWAIEPIYFAHAFALDDTGRWSTKNPSTTSWIMIAKSITLAKPQKMPASASLTMVEEAGAFTFGAENSGVVDVHRGVYGGVTRGWGGSGMVLVWQRHGLWLCVVAEVRLAAEAVGRGAVLAQKGSGAEAKCIEWWRSGCGCATDLPYHHARQFL